MRNNLRVEFFLCLFLGYFGVHKFKQGKTGMGVLYLFTCGLAAIGWIIDTVTLFYYAFIANQDKLIEYKNKEEAKAETRELNKNLRAERRKQMIIEASQANSLKNSKKVELDRQGIPYCPKCLSTYVQYVDRRKQLSLGRAAVGGALFGVTGAVVGGVTSKKHKGVMKCLKCGHEWRI